MAENAVILGATSGIARPLCQLMAARGCALILAGRDQAKLQEIAESLNVEYGIETHVERFDALDFDGHSAFVTRCFAHFDGRLTGAVLCYGELPDQRVSQTDFAVARHSLDVNLTSPISVLNLIAERLEQQHAGYIAAVSSVAGDRGRQSNYTYGTAKAGLSAYLEGLRNRLYHQGVHVLTIKPGFIDTPMTAGRVDPTSWMVASADRVAGDIDRAIRKRKNVLYTPWFWRGILIILCSLPSGLFKRLKT